MGEELARRIFEIDRCTEQVCAWGVRPCGCQESAWNVARIVARLAAPSSPASAPSEEQVRELLEENKRLNAKLIDERAHHARHSLNAGDAAFKAANRLVDITWQWAADPAAWDKENEDRTFRQIRYAAEHAFAPSAPASGEPSGEQQKGYIVLAEEERAKGFVRPVRASYTHEKCGA